MNKKILLSFRIFDFKFPLLCSNRGFWQPYKVYHLLGVGTFLRCANVIYCAQSLFDKASNCEQKQCECIKYVSGSVCIFFFVLWSKKCSCVDENDGERFLFLLALFLFRGRGEFSFNLCLLYEGDRKSMVADMKCAPLCFSFFLIKKTIIYSCFLLELN